MFDLIVRDGTVIDGTKAGRFRADVGILNSQIEAVGDLSSAAAARKIDAKGRIVAPGFIDLHNHSDGWLLKTPHLAAKTTQGFTTEVLMADGISYAPVRRHNAAEWLFYLRSLNALRIDEYRGWESLTDYLGEIDRRNVQNFAVHVPYANVRVNACGWGRAPADDFQRREIREAVREGLEAGAVGLSTGLDYISQCFAGTDELVAACEAMAESRGLYVTHMRYKMGLLPALREAIEIGKRAGVPVHISHLKAPDAREAEKVLQYIDREARHEVDLSFDVYPYQPGSTMLNFLLPYEVWEDGPLAALGKLTDPAIQERFAAGLDAYDLELDKIHIAWTHSKENARHQGKLLSDYVAESGVSAAQALCNLLIEERLAVLLVFNQGDDSLVRPFLSHDLYLMGSDGIFFEEGVIHPRMYGSAPRLLGPCVRDWKLFSLEEAVHKLSGGPARRFGLKDRGEIRPGAWADLVVFDSETVADRATYDHPHQFAVGIQHVLVNGVPIVEGGQPRFNFDGPLPGRALHSERG
ncbi:MAG TPA: D-aminoacylase [Planctomycetaceae bacterium]|nr:D-aminoacylase [Planctomycetaceae bacterium]